MSFADSRNFDLVVPLQTLERRLCAAGVIFEDAAAAAKPPPKKTVRQGTYQKTASDEDSDFD